MSRVALDTVVFAASIDTRDKWHRPALALRDALAANAAELIVFDVVVNEAVSVLMRRLHEQGRRTQVDHLLDLLEQQAPSHQITWISQATSRLYPEILALIRQYRGKLNFHDALIALSCRELAIPYIVSFDRDFDQVAWLTRIDTPADVPQT